MRKVARRSCPLSETVPRSFNKVISFLSYPTKKINHVVFLTYQVVHISHVSTMCLYAVHALITIFFPCSTSMKEQRDGF